MTIEEIREDKRNLEHKIKKLIDEFQKEYDVTIDDIEFDNMISRNMKGEAIRNSTIFIKINL